MRIPLLRLLLIISTVLALAACNGTKSNDTSTVLATVNGTPITNNMFRAYVRSLTGGRDMELNQMQRDQVLQHMVDMMVLAQSAEKSGRDKDPKVAAELSVERVAMLAQAEARNYMDSHPVTDDQIKAAYAKRFGSAGGEEYRARHILVPDESKAKSIIAQLEKGADFAKLAKKYSTDSSSKNGGDLGWFSPDQMVPEFSQAVENLKKGEFTKAPVHTQYGWHVIQLEDTRAAEQPSMDTMRKQLESDLQGKNIQDYVEGLRKAATVDIKAPEKGTTAAPAKASIAQKPESN